MVNYNNFDIKAREVIPILCNIKNNRGKNIPIFTTSQIRKILALAISTDNKVDYSKQELTEKNLYDIKKIYVKLVYQGGREDSVKGLINKSGILDLLDKIQETKQSKDFKLLVDYLEAIVAWRKLEGGKDQ